MPLHRIIVRIYVIQLQLIKCSLNAFHVPLVFLSLSQCVHVSCQAFILSFFLRDYFFLFLYLIDRQNRIGQHKANYKDNECPIICWPMHLVSAISRNVNIIGPIWAHETEKKSHNNTNNHNGTVPFLKP